MDTSSTSSHPSYPQNPTILVIDDMPANLSVLADHLEGHGFTVLVARDGASGLERAYYGRPDLILLDVLMPGMGGFETCRRLKADPITQDIPVIFVTAISDTINEVKGFELGAVDYITKPFQLERVLARIKTHLTLRQLQKDLKWKNDQLQQEIDERELVEEALRESEARLQAIIATAVDGIITINEQGTIETINPAGAQIFGYTATEIIGQNVNVLMPAPYHQEHDQYLKNYLTTGIKKIIGIGREVRGQRKNQTIFPMELSVSEIQINERRIFTGIVRDITKRKQAEETLQQQRRLAEERNKELNAFARTVAHDIKAPLGLVVGYTDYLVEFFSKLDPEDVLEHLKKVRGAGQKGNNIVDELLLLAGVRKQKVPLKPLKMEKVVDQAQQRLELMIEEYQGEIIVPPASAWPTAVGYAPWLQEVWVNYLSNGLKYGGQPPRLALGATPQSDGMVRFWVQDNGLGLPPEAQTRLFTEFTRLEEMRAEGHGLGLSIVRRIVEKFGGQVGVESEVGQGSTFYFTLPGTEKPLVDSEEDIVTLFS